MSAVESLIFAYFLNAAWQFPLLAGSAALLLRLLRRPSPRTEHSLWILTSLLAALLPLAVGLGLLDPAPMTPLLKSQSPQLPPTGYRLLLAFVLFAALRKAVHFLRAAIATHRIRRSAPRSAFARAWKSASRQPDSKQPARCSPEPSAPSSSSRRFSPWPIAVLCWRPPWLTN